jgi:hypothetical protein
VLTRVSARTPCPSGKGTTKPDRDTCKECGSSEWIAATAETEALKNSVTSEAKMMNTMEGAEEKDDVVMQCQLPEALAALHGMVRAAASAAGDKRTWELRGVHLGKGPAEGASLDDFLTAFLHWCQKDEDRSAGSFNISKVCLHPTPYTLTLNPKP